MLQLVSENLKSKRDINALTRTNRYFYNLLNPYLYQHNIRLSGSSALLWAATFGREGIARKMSAEGADARKESEYGDTPLFAAAMGGHKAIVGLLLAEYGLNPDPQDCRLRTPLSLAAEIRE
jgi:ankyrin repeat protein